MSYSAVNDLAKAMKALDGKNHHSSKSRAVTQMSQTTSKEFLSFEKRFFQLLQMNVFSSNSQIPCKKLPQIQSQHQVPWTFRAISRTRSLGKIAIDVQTYRHFHETRRLQAISDFLGRPKENRASETTSEVQTLTELSEIKRNFRDFERLEET